MVELEESRRKLVNLKMQRDAAVGMHAPAPSAVNGNLSPEKTTDRFWQLTVFLSLKIRPYQKNWKVKVLRNVLEIKQSECRAHSQAEVLKSSLNEHSLELRVKAAIEAEAACHQRLSATEAEIAELRAKLDASERDVLELKEAIKSKDKEAESIGQAYEDMQTQNQHLLQQVGERDDYNIKASGREVVVRSNTSCVLIPRERLSFSLSRARGGQALAKHLQQVNASVESLKSRIAHSEEQMKHYVIEAVRSTKEDRHLAINLESALLELMDAEKELK
ncbi:hypothetical protein Peur_056380 [Populus x canadensis]